jgi:hypothetical protein
MALFTAEDIYSPKDHTETILLDCFIVPDGEPIPTLEIYFTSEIRKLESRAAKKHNGFKMKILIDQGDPQGKGEATPIDEPQEYCHEILEAAYKDSTGIFKQPTKELILAAIDEKPVFARALASKILECFEKKDVQIKAAEEDTKKN